MIDLKLNSQENKAQAEFRHFALRVMRPFAARADRIANVPEELLQKPEVLNFMRCCIPAEFGGGWRGLLRHGDNFEVAKSARLRMVLSEEGGFGDASLFIALPGLGPAEPILAALGSAEQQKRLFGLFSEDRPRWAAFAISEPQVGSDVAAVGARAARQKDGYVINGTKWFVGNGARADWVVVFASTGQDRGRFGLRAFIVERGVAGFHVDGILPSTGLRAVQLSALRFEDCLIPHENLLGPEQFDLRKGGFSGAMRTFDLMRPSVAAIAAGIGREALEQIEEIVLQNGAGHFLAHRWRDAREWVGMMKIRLHAARLLCWKSAWLYDQGQDNSMASSMAKAYSAKVAMTVCAEALDIAAKAAVVDLSSLERLFRNAKAFDILEGTGDIQRLMLARSLPRHCGPDTRLEALTTSAPSNIQSR